MKTKKVLYPIDEIGDFANKTKVIHDLYFGAAEMMAKESVNTNRFSYKNP